MANELLPGHRPVSSWQEVSDLWLADAAEKYGRAVSAPLLCTAGPPPHTEPITARGGTGSGRVVCGVCGLEVTVRLDAHNGVTWDHLGAKVEDHG
jgi:hypothetical protein